MNLSDYITVRFRSDLQKIETSIHVKTLKGGYPDVVVVGEEIYNWLKPELKEVLDSKFGNKLIIKSKMYSPMLRYIWFGDNEHFIEDEPNIYMAQNIITNLPFSDEERTLELKTEYLNEDCDDKDILTILT